MAIFWTTCKEKYDVEYDYRKYGTQTKIYNDLKNLSYLMEEMEHSPELVRLKDTYN